MESSRSESSDQAYWLYSGRRLKVHTGSYIASVACEVRLDNGVLFQACIATTSCPGGTGPTCGGRDSEAFAGIDSSTGKAYASCRRGNFISEVSCP